MIDKEEGWLRSGEMNGLGLFPLQNLMLSAIKRADDVDKIHCFKVCVVCTHSGSSVMNIQEIVFIIERLHNKRTQLNTNPMLVKLDHRACS